MGKHVRASGRPLLVTSSESFLDDVLQLTSIRRAEVQLAPDLEAARLHWLAASIVVLDEALVDASAVSLPTRPGLVLVGRDLDDPTIWQRAVDIGAEHVVFLPDAALWLAQQFNGQTPTDTATCVAVMGGCGGAGASTLSVALATAASASGLESVLVDGDPFGGGIELLLGAEDAPGVRWDGLADASGSVDHELLVEALPSAQGVSFLSWSSQASHGVSDQSVISVLASLLRSPGIVIIDVGCRPSPDVVQHLSESATLVAVIVPARVRAVAAAKALLNRHRRLHDRMELLVRTPSPGGLEPKEIATILDLPLIGAVPNDPRRAEWEEHGLAPDNRSPWRGVCDGVLAKLRVKAAA